MRAFLLLLLVCGQACAAAGDPRELIFNGNFAAGANGRPAGWETSGAQTVEQKLTSDRGRDGMQCARLDCTAFAGDGPSHHAMLCQVGHVAVRKGQWYRLTFWAKAAGIKGGSVEVALTNMRPWENAGLEEAFTPQTNWQRFEMLFRAKENLAATHSRLQFWFKGTGTFWLDAVSLMESEVGQQWYPQISTEGVKNFVPNSSFECGGAGWGSISYGLPGWAGNLYRLEGELDCAAPQHGGHSLKLVLNPRTLPVYWFDYYDPVRQPVRRIFTANKGWFAVKPGERLTLSACLRADLENTTAEFVINECNGWTQKKQVTVGKDWHRHEFSFVPRQPFIFIAIGTDLDASHRDAATLWLDAIQLERGERATAYEPRAPVESFIASAAEGSLHETGRWSATHRACFQQRRHHGQGRQSVGSGEFLWTARRFRLHRVRGRAAFRPEHPVHRSLYQPTGLLPRRLDRERRNAIAACGHHHAAGSGCQGFAAGFQPRLSMGFPRAPRAQRRHRLVARLVGEVAGGRAGEREIRFRFRRCADSARARA
ncbi:MAG: carbohydrate binding domain-containing protein [Kiritimatiellaeota bacterium]|nr:carbohydrate binding domain-containing protein [Kiritimatiellota bacterium]